MYVSVRKYTVSPRSVDELRRRVEEGFVPIVSQASGFLGYYVLDAGNDTVASISLFSNRDGADNSNQAASAWVRKNLASLVSGPPEITAGEVIVHKSG